MTSLPNHRYLLTRLQREWTLISSRRSSVEQASAWKLTARVIGSLDELLVLTGLGPGPVDPASDETMRRLVAVARHDDLAARVVLQRMLPGLSSIAKRHSDGFDSQLDALDELLSVAWAVIRSFSIETRDRYVIKNLLRDCEHQAFLKSRRRRMIHELTDPADLDTAMDGDDSDQEPLGTIVELLGRAKKAGMTEADIAMVVTLLNTSTVKEAAAALRVTDRTVRNRRHSVIHQLRELAGAA
jgi:hypothetical protein